MKRSKSAKRALLLSALSMLLCLAMLVGSTFAWFTDSVTSGKNKIVAGNLDVELEYSMDGTNWNPVGADTSLFKPVAETLWEPGHTEYVYLRVRNAGSLALKYQFAVNVYGDENGGAEKIYTNKDGNPFKLSEHLVFTKINGVATVDNRDDLWISDAAAEAAAMGNLDGLGMTGVLLPEGKGTTENPTEQTLTLAVYMPTQVGNEANQLTSAQGREGKPTIFLGLTLVATQTPYEEDSFRDDYDQGAFYPTDEDAAAAGQDVKVNGVYYKDLASAVAAAAPQSTVTLIDNTTVEKSVKLDNEDVLTIDLNGKTLEAPNGTAINMSNGGELTLVNGTVNSKDYAVYAAQDAVIHELNIDMNAGFWGVYLGENAVLEKVTGGTYKSNDASESNFSLYVTSNAKIGEISGGDFQGSKAAIANYGTIEKISGGTFHGTYYDGTNATIWEPQYSVMYDGNIGSITGGTFFKGEKNIAQNMPKFNAALTAGGTTLVELPDTSTIAYKKSGTILTEYTGHYYKVSKTDKAYVETVFGERVTYTTDNKITSLSVATADELLLLNDLDLAKVISHGEGNPCKITITNDIDMSGATWRAMHGQFVTIDGQGHTISNLNCTQGTSGKAGFISYLGAGKITNLTLNNVTASGCQAGAFAGQLEDGTIENCVLKGTVTITWEQCSGTYNEVYNAIGALVGWKNSGTVGTVDVTGATIQLVKDGMEAETSDTAKAYWTADNNLVGAIMR